MAEIILSAAALAVSGVSTYASVTEAKQANRRAADYQSAVRRAEAERAEMQMTEAQRAAAAQREQRTAEAQLIRSRIRAAAGEAGIGEGGTYEALMRQAVLDEQENLSRINATLFNQIRTLRAGGTTFLQSSPNVWLEATAGALSGLGQGLQIARGIRDLSKPASRTS